MPTFIRLEKTESSHEYERGWAYVETRNGRLCMVRKTRDAVTQHRGGGISARPRERIAREVFLVEREPELVTNEHHPSPRGGKIFIDVNRPLRHRRGSSSSDEALPPTLRPRIQVRRPINAPASPTFDTHEIRPRYMFMESADARLVKKVPIEKARLHRVRPIQIEEENTYCDEDEYGYEEVFDPCDVPAREARPYHIPEPENSVWDDELQAWMVSRKPRVRFE
jgi:hypothetical protein